METRKCEFQNVKGLHFCHLNIRSLWNKFDLVKPLILNSGLTLMSFSETWLNDNLDTNMIHIPGYICYRQDRTWSENNIPKKGGGVCCYVKNDICVSNTEFGRYNRSTKDIEILWLSLIIPNCKKIIIGNVYRPPQGNVKKFSENLDDLIQEIGQSNQSLEYFILGDFNINYKANNNPETKLLKWFEQKAGFKQIISDITRFSNNNSCIDLIFTNSNAVFNSGTLDVNLSDHEMIFITRRHIQKERNPTSFIGRSYKNYNEDILIEQLSACNWDIFYQCTDPEIAWNIMENNILDIIDVMCPLQTFHVKHLKDPWISQEILEAIKDKDRLLCRAKRTNQLDDWTLARRRRNEVKAIVKNAKSDFIKENLVRYGNDSKKFWKSIRDVVPSSKSCTNIKITLKDKFNQIIEDPKLVSNEMNKFFTSIGPNLAKDMRDPWTYAGIEINEDIDDITTNDEEVLKYLKDINVNKSSAIKELSSKVLKPAFIHLVHQLTFIYNLCFTMNVFPCKWKKAIVTPLPKDGDLSQCTNYRPISQLPLPGKILEQIIHNRIDTFCNTNNILMKIKAVLGKNTLLSLLLQLLLIIYTMLLILKNFQ